MMLAALNVDKMHATKLAILWWFRKQFLLKKFIYIYFFQTLSTIEFIYCNMQGTILISITNSLFIINGEDEKCNKPIKKREKNWTLKVYVRSPYMFLNIDGSCVCRRCTISTVIPSKQPVDCLHTWCNNSFERPNCIQKNVCSNILLTYQIWYQFIFMLFIEISISCTCIVSNIIHGTYRVRLTEQLMCIEHIQNTVE